jgi:hypothetical protein
VKVRRTAENLSSGKVVPVSTVEVVCGNCGFDLSGEEVKTRERISVCRRMSKCPSCRKELHLKRSVAIEVATLPSVFSTVQT